MQRRDFIKKSKMAATALGVGPFVGKVPFRLAAKDPSSLPGDIEVLNPRGRVPVSFIIDDSTALVNMAHFGIPQFHQTFPDRYPQDWRKLPREIPDDFVREFLDWCDERGVKGKYSMVPYPACTGWLHRFIPGWTKQALQDSLALVRERAAPNWDIHPEMISHTRVIDIKTGLPYADPSPDFMENWAWSQTRSADELGAYIAYALNVLKEAGFYCDGVTTPGGFGSRNIPNLALGTRQAVQDVFGAPIAHFFRDVVTDPEQSVAPQVMHPEGLEGDNPTCSVHIIGCTGDWFGGWDGLVPGDADRFITPDLQSGRMVEVIERGEPAIMVCHWPGIYFNGERTGFRIFQTVVERLHQKYDHLIWMKLTDIARYWAVRELGQFERTGREVRLQTPFAVKDFTLRVPAANVRPHRLHGAEWKALERVRSADRTQAGTWMEEGDHVVLCLDLPRGETILDLAPG